VGVGGLARWLQRALHQLLGVLSALRRLVASPPGAPGVHVAIGGVFADLERLLRELEPLWAQVDQTTRTRWERDRPLLSVAGRVRAQRLATAWRALGAAD